MSKAYQLRVIDGAVSEFGDSFVLRGVIDPSTYMNIKVDTYQRDEGSVSDLAGLVEAFKSGQEIPDVEIGIRGGDYSVRDGVHFIKCDCYMIDGLQRLTAAKRAMAQKPDLDPKLGAKFHFNTDYKWEKDRFRTLNKDRRKVSPNVLLRNDADELVSVGMLLSMSKSDADFVLRGRIAWGQKMNRNELITALVVLRVIGALHSHFGPGLTPNIDGLTKAVDKTIEIIGPNKWRENVRLFFLAVDQAFGVKMVAFRDTSPWIKAAFLKTLAMVFAEHSDFWDGTRLVIPRWFIDRLKKFPVNAPDTIALIKSTSTVHPILYRNLVSSLDSGKRTGRMKKWNGAVADGILSIEVNREFTDEQRSAEELAS